MTYPIHDGPGGGEFTVEDHDIQKVDGDGHWIIWGVGQNLHIRDKKDGRGSLTLKNFGDVEIDTKNGDGALIVEACRSIKIREVNGSGDTHLRIEGLKRLELKDGAGDVFFRGAPPIVGRMNGAGQIRREV